MADYIPLIAKAIESLSDKSPVVRKAVYERARKALVTQLQALNPPATPVDVDRERAALDLAISAVEARYVLPSQQTPVEGNLPPEPGQTFPETAVPADPLRELQQVIEGDAADAGTDAATLDGDIAEADGDEPAGDETPEEEPVAAAEDEPAADATPGQIAGEEANGRVERPRIEARHEPLRQARRTRATVLVITVLAVVAAIAGLAIYNRGNPAKDGVPASEQASNAPDAPSETGKYTERLGGSVAPTTSPTGSGSAATVAVQQAILFEEDPANIEVPKASEGQVQWHLDMMDAGPGLPLETVVRADVSFPASGLSLAMLLRHNTDAGFPASHTIQLTFSQKPDDKDLVVRDAGLILLKDDVTERGMQLTSVPVPVKDNIFLIGLSNLPADMERNIQLLQTKSWFDVPVRFANGRRAILSFEKGTTGYQAISDAFRRW